MFALSEPQVSHQEKKTGLKLPPERIRMRFSTSSHTVPGTTLSTLGKQWILFPMALCAWEKLKGSGLPWNFLGTLQSYSSCLLSPSLLSLL